MGRVLAGLAAGLLLGWFAFSSSDGSRTASTGTLRSRPADRAVPAPGRSADGQTPSAVVEPTAVDGSVRSLDDARSRRHWPDFKRALTELRRQGAHRELIAVLGDTTINFDGFQGEWFAEALADVHRPELAVAARRRFEHELAKPNGADWTREWLPLLVAKGTNADLARLDQLHGQPKFESIVRHAYSMESARPEIAERLVPVLNGRRDLGGMWLTNFAERDPQRVHPLLMRMLDDTGVDLGALVRPLAYAVTQRTLEATLDRIALHPELKLHLALPHLEDRGFDLRPYAQRLRRRPLESLQDYANRQGSVEDAWTAAHVVEHTRALHEEAVLAALDAALGMAAGRTRTTMLAAKAEIRATLAGNKPEWVVTGR